MNSKDMIGCNGDMCRWRLDCMHYSLYVTGVTIPSLKPREVLVPSVLVTGGKRKCPMFAKVDET